MSRLEALKKVIKPRNIIVIILLLVVNTFAWFIYATQVDNSMSAHVRAWNVLFEAGDSPIVDYVDVNVESMYPGMEEFYYVINAHNKSEVSAQLSYTLLEANILGQKYTSIEGRDINKETVLPTDLSSNALISKLANDYPFTIAFSLTTEEMDAEIGKAKYEIRVNWPYDSGDDSIDTFWGKTAADYKALNSSEASITLKVKISIAQKT